MPSRVCDKDFEKEAIMIKINVREGLKPPLPPATPGEVIQVCIWAFFAIAIVGGLFFGALFLLDRLLH